MRRSSHTRLAMLGMIASAASLAACEADRAISTEQTGDPAYGAQLVLTAGTAAYNLPRGTVRFKQLAAVGATPGDSGVTDTLTVTLQGLDTLEAGNYTIWAGNQTSATNVNWKRLTGTLDVIRFDTTLNALGDPTEVQVPFQYFGVSAFSRGGARQRMTFKTNRVLSGLTAADTVDIVLVSIESSTSATATPSVTRRPLWARRPAMAAGDTITRNLNFGFFSLNADSQYVYIPTGRGRALIRGDILVLADSGLGTPPQGYYYAAWAVRRDTFYVTRPRQGSTTAIDTIEKLLPDTVYLGPQTTPFPGRLSLFEADTRVIDSDVQLTNPRSILSAANRFDLRSVDAHNRPNPYRGFQTITVTLESKDADTPSGAPENQLRMGPAILLQATVPDILRIGRP